VIPSRGSARAAVACLQDGVGEPEVMLSGVDVAAAQAALCHGSGKDTLTTLSWGIRKIRSCARRGGASRNKAPVHVFELAGQLSEVGAGLGFSTTPSESLFCSTSVRNDPYWLAAEGVSRRASGSAPRPSPWRVRPQCRGVVSVRACPVPTPAVLGQDEELSCPNARPLYHGGEIAGQSSPRRMAFGFRRPAVRLPRE
jgi:hypothetical protein